MGKSSLINLIAGEKISKTSSSAVGCTLDYKRHLLKLGDQRFAIWDTAGLDEGTQGTVPAEKAEVYLKELLRDLAKASGIDLLIYCVRGTRVRSALLANYHLFYSAICRKKVPIAIVITGLENQEGNMDTWWLTNEKQFSALKMHFDNYACVTTLESSIENATLKERRKISRTALIKMITSTCRTEQWMPAERSWIDTAFSDIRTILSPRNGQGVHMANVIMCDVSRHVPIGQAALKRSVTFHNPVTLSLSLTRPMSLRSPVSVVNEKSRGKLPFDDALKCTPERLFRVYQVPRKQTLSWGKEAEMKNGMIVKRGADLLIFCVEKGVGDGEDVKLQWEYFKLTYGGDLSPQIVIIIGATDQLSAEEWWNDAVGGVVTKPGDPSIAYWPIKSSVAEAEGLKGRLRDLINTCCIDCSKVNFAGDKQIFRHNTSLRLDKSSITLWMRPLTKNRKVDLPVVDQDILTKGGVWEHISAGRNAVTRSNTVPCTFTSRDDQEQNVFRPYLS